MTIPIGFDFRATQVFATDPSNCYLNNGSATSGTSGGIPWTWNDSNVQFSVADVDNGIDARLAGAVFRITGAGNFVFTVTLPSTGVYLVNLALGQNNAGRTHSFTVDDTITTFINFASVATGSGQFLDANGNITNAATWATNNPAAGGGTGGKSCTFATTTAVFTLFPSAIDATVLAHIMLSQVAATPPIPFNKMQRNSRHVLIR